MEKEYFLLINVFIYTTHILEDVYNRSTQRDKDVYA